MSHRAYWLSCGVVCVAWALTGCQPKADAKFELPEYVLVSMEEARKPALADIEAHRGESEASFESLQKIPVAQRYQLFVPEHDYTWVDYQKENLAYLSERFEGNYQKTTADRGEALERGTAFLKEYSKYYGGASKIPRADLIKLGQAAREAGSESVLVRLAQLEFSELTGSALSAEFEKLLPELQNAKIHPLHRARQSLWMRHLSNQKTPGVEESQRRLFGVIATQVAYLERDSSTANPRLVWSQFTSLYWTLTLSEKRHMVYALWENDKIDPWIVHLAAGTYFRDLAYHNRGGSFASNVSEGQWAGMREASQQAEEHLLRAWQLAPDRPEVPTEIISLCMLSETRHGSVSDWFYEAVRGQSDWGPAYGKYWFAMQPRWGGSNTQLLEFANQCIDTGRYDTLVPGVTVDILKHIESDVGSLEDLVRLPGVPEVSKKFEDGLQAAIGRGMACTADISEVWGYLVRMRVLTGEFPAARKIYETYGRGQLGLSALGQNGLKSSFIRGLTYASTGPAQAEVSAFETFLNTRLEEGSELAVLDEIGEVLKEAMRLDTHPGSQAYYKDISVIESHLRAYYTDQWVDLTFDDRLSGIYVEANQLDFLPEGVLHLASASYRTGIQLRPMAHFRPPFVCEVELALGSQDRPAQNAVGLLYGSRDRRSIYAQQPMRSLYLSSRAEVVNVFDGTDAQRFAQTYWPLRASPFHHLRMIVLPHQLELQVDRETISQLSLDEGAITDGFTVGEMIPAPNASSFRLRNLRIKRLHVGDRPAASASPEKQWEFQTAIRELDPRSPTAWYLEGLTQIQRKDYPKAVECFDKYLALNPFQSQPQFRLLYAECLKEVSRWRDAEKEYLAMIAVEDNPLIANTALGWMYATASEDDFRDGAKALQHAQLACELNQSSPAKQWLPYMALAVAHAEKGQHAEAVQQIELALAVAPEGKKEFIRGVQTKIVAHEPVRYVSVKPVEGKP